MQLTRARFKTQLRMLLRDLPRATSADLADFAIAYWDGEQVVFAFLSEEHPGEIDEEFDLDDYVWEDWRNQFAAWVAKPVFSVRPEVKQWLNEAPPRDAGI
jgi:hypothetical protein